MERKEAIEVVRKNYPHVSESGSQFETALRTLVPELQESEDERIRKDLIHWVETNISYERMPVGMNYSNECVLAWLEKQGEKSSPYKAAIESIAAMVEKCAYFNINLQDFFNNVKVKCKDAMEYDKTFKQE
jgi:hypothetical protein